MPTHVPTAVLALALLLPAAAGAQEQTAQQPTGGCADELAQLDRTVNPAELSDRDRAAYADLSDTAREYLADGDQLACVKTIGLIRRQLYITSVETPDDGGSAATTADDSE